MSQRPPQSARGPRRIADVLGVVRSEGAPATPLAVAQAVWPQVAGETVAGQAEPVAERSGVLTIACRSATWAQELDLMGPDLLGRLNEALVKTGSQPFDRLRFTADASRHPSFSDR